jgi:peroxiredoxin
MAALLWGLSLWGCGSAALEAPGTSAPAESASGGSSGYYDYYGSYGTAEITFLDDVQSNVTAGDEVGGLSFVDVDGKTTRLRDFVGSKSVVLVITRGNTNPICPYCTTQTSRLIANYAKFSERNAEVIVVYPIERPQDETRLADFLRATRDKLDDPEQPVPFPILLDVELVAVDRLGIRKDLSKPATYILDPRGKIRFAYVGADLADRPSVAAMLEQLDLIASEGTADSAETAVPPVVDPAGPPRDEG